MQLHPTRSAVDLTLAGMLAVGTAVVARSAPALAWSGAILVGLAIARAVTRLSVARIRAAGFEMLWRQPERVRSIARNETLELMAEVRNRDTRAARYVELRAVGSPDLEIEVEPNEGEVPAGGRLEVTVKVTPPRVGRHGIHGLSLEVQGSPGLFEVPLTFANPYGIEVLPRPFSTALHTARGGRSRHGAEAGRPGPLAGEGLELKELREHAPGDPFKRIAWKASARRGKLMVREYEQDERDVVWLVLDASIELWAGTPGKAPLDIAIDELAAVASRHLAKGDRVGLVIVATRILCYIPADSGVGQLGRLMGALAHDTGTVDADRSDLDESDVGLRVLEHLRPLDPEAASRVRPTELDRIARRVVKALPRAPFQVHEPLGNSKRERTLRQYLVAFGMGSPPRQEPERNATDRTLGQALARITREKPRPSMIAIWSPAPDMEVRPDVERALSQLPRRRCQVLWVPMTFEAGLPRTDWVAEAVAEALSMRERAAASRGERGLRRLGVRVLHTRPKHQGLVNR
ncbi:MAG: DUF58 domain-containing protein [Polyangiaceae bacterium]|nr:DUF58 domain-containing protein [Polyangiaceae bacterium]MCB9605300.1 DUF58 domain-containing protein [Polyangiaceae bacterium]